MVEIKAADDAPSVSDDPSSYKHDRRVVIYPSYINSKCSVAEGRRIPKDCRVRRPERAGDPGRAGEEHEAPVRG